MYMEVLRVEHVTIHPKSIHSALDVLEKTIERHTRLKRQLEEILALQGGMAPGRGRPGKDSPEGRMVRGPGRPARGEITLRQAILQVLRGRTVPVKPIELVNLVLASGYPTSAKPQSFYIAVFNTAKKEPAVKKSKAGFELRAGYKPAEEADR
jgi:hypothetical protein